MPTSKYRMLRYLCIELSKSDDGIYLEGQREPSDIIAHRALETPRLSLEAINV